MSVGALSLGKLHQDWIHCHGRSGVGTVCYGVSRPWLWAVAWPAQINGWSWNILYFVWTAHLGGSFDFSVEAFQNAMMDGLVSSRSVHRACWKKAFFSDFPCFPCRGARLFLVACPWSLESCSSQPHFACLRMKDPWVSLCQNQHDIFSEGGAHAICDMWDEPVVACLRQGAGGAMLCNTVSNSQLQTT